MANYKKKSDKGFYAIIALIVIVVAAIAYVVISGSIDTPEVDPAAGGVESGAEAGADNEITDEAAA